jgi:hypothetical protein
VPGPYGQKHEAESTSAISLSLAASASVPDGTAWQTDDIFGVTFDLKSFLTE